MDRIDKICISIFILGVIAIALILMISGCDNLSRNNVETKVATSMPVTANVTTSAPATANITTTMPVEINPVVKLKDDTVAPKSNNTATSGGNTYQFINNQTGGSAILGLIVVCIYLFVRAEKPKKALKTTTDYLESLGHSAKRQVQYMAMEQGTEKYLNKKVKKWYPNSTASQSQKQTAK